MRFELVGQLLVQLLSSGHVGIAGGVDYLRRCLIPVHIRRNVFDYEMNRLKFSATCEF